MISSGKLDRAALPEPDAAATSAPESAHVPPRTPVEEVLAAIWAEVLKAERVGATDNFFEIGGHSLLAARAVGRIREVFGADLPPLMHGVVWSLSLNILTYVLLSLARRERS